MLRGDLGIPPNLLCLRGIELDELLAPAEIRNSVTQITDALRLATNSVRQIANHRSRLGCNAAFRLGELRTHEIDLTPALVLSSMVAVFLSTELVSTS
jgi:hypothetical protein